MDGAEANLFGRRRQGWTACICEERADALRFPEALSSDGDREIEGRDMDRAEPDAGPAGATGNGTVPFRA